MFNFRKIGILMLAAALFCILQANVGYAQELPANNSFGYDWKNYTPGSDFLNYTNYTKNSATGTKLAACQKSCTQTGYECKPKNLVEQDPDYECKKVADVPQKTTSTNAKQSQSAVTGCSSNQGIFSGLISTGSKVFNGLRDLIYVVAGFGIIGVAVGGFFGNLNWKWLGAIVISLVVIATTGELISAITGCENFTNAMITDTLK